MTSMFERLSDMDRQPCNKPASAPLKSADNNQGIGCSHGQQLLELHYQQHALQLVRLYALQITV